MKKKPQLLHQKSMHLTNHNDDNVRFRFKKLENLKTPRLKILKKFSEGTIEFNLEPTL